MFSLFSKRPKRRPQPFPPLAEYSSREEWEGLVRKSFQDFSDEYLKETRSARGKRREARWWVKYWFKDMFRYAWDAVVAWRKSKPFDKAPDPHHRFPSYREFDSALDWCDLVERDHARVIVDIERTHQRWLAVFSAKTALGRARNCVLACVDACHPRGGRAWDSHGKTGER